MRIEQAYVSPSLSHFRYEFLECWNLREYDNSEEPAVFYVYIMTGMITKNG